MLNELKEITVMRSLAIILIILSHLHIFVYPISENYLLLITSNYIARIGLGIFFFISGFGLYYKNPNIHSLTGFYKKRFIRIYPFYWFAIFATCLHDFFLGPINAFSISTDGSYILAATIIGLQGFIPRYSSVFWFIGVILIYYLMYPILIYPKKIYQMLILYSLFFATLLLMGLLQIIMTRIGLYFLAFVFGIMTNRMLSGNNRILQHISTISLAVFIISTMILFLSPGIINQVSDQILIPYTNKPAIILIVVLTQLAASLVAVCGSMVIYNSIRQHPINYDILTKISFSSFSLYLFHGLILGTFAASLDYYNITTLVIFSILPILFVICYYIQKAELQLVNWFRTYY